MEDFITKLCTKCGEEKVITEFHASKKGKFGVCSQCIYCKKKFDKKYYEENKEKRAEHSKKYYEENKEKRAEQIKKYDEKNKEKNADYRKKYYKDNKEKIADYRKKWKQSEAGKNSLRMSSRKFRSTPKTRLSNSISSNIRQSLKSGSKNKRHWEDLVGWTTDELKRHLEKQFIDGMTWDNYGRWHIDHRVPVSAFNYEKPEDSDFKRCWALDNLQPMWATENISKGNKLLKHFQPSLIFK